LNNVSYPISSAITSQEYWLNHDFNES
jgi:hypothetical protein